MSALPDLDREFVRRVAGRLADHVRALGSPWAARVVSWMDLVDLCRELDDSLVMAEHISPEVLDLHRNILGLGISNGERLMEEVRAANADISASGYTLPIMGASLDMLRIFHSSQHSACSPSEIESARNRIFNAAA
jgi:hypothetical protein